MKKLIAFLLAALMLATLLSVGAAFGWEENEGLTLKFDDATTLWELGTWMSFSGSEIEVGRRLNGSDDYYYAGFEVKGDIECPYAVLELQNGTVYEAEYVLSEAGNICARLPLHLVPIGEPFRAEYRFVVTRGNSGAVKWVNLYDKDGKCTFTSSEMTFDASATKDSPNEPSGIDYLALTTATPHRQPDTTLSTWAVEPVAAAIATGLVPQSLQHSYAQATTRAEFCALAVALYENLKGGITGHTTFSDTTDVNVEKAAAIGVVAGVGDNRFDPDAALTREQAATMLARLAEALGHPLPKTMPTFADSMALSSWAVVSVGSMQVSGVMGGVGDNLFSPKTAYTREQSIVTLWRLYGMMR